MTAFDELLRRTDPDLVTIELDCGWVKVAGLDPADFIAKHASRVEAAARQGREGRARTLEPLRPGRPVRGGRPRHDRLAQGIRGRPEGGRRRCYVEQDATERPPLDAIKISRDYLHDLKVEWRLATRHDQSGRPRRMRASRSRPSGSEVKPSRSAPAIEGA